MKSIALCILCLFLHFTSEGKYAFDFNKNCQDAHSAIGNLRFNEARLIIQKEKKLHPENLICLYLENYIDFLSIIISEEKSRFDALKKNKDLRLQILKLGDKNSPYYLLTQAEINLQWAFARIKFSEYITAAFEVNKAYEALEENQKKFPDFILTKKSLGLLHAVIGSIPNSYQWAVKMLGFSGTVKQGEKEIMEVFTASLSNEAYASYQSETTLLLSIAELNLGNNENFVKKTILPLLEKKSNPSPIDVFCYANNCLKLSKPAEAIAYLQKNTFGKDVFPFHYLNFLLGQAKLSLLDKNADIPLLQFINQFKGRNYIKAAYLRLAWLGLIKGDETKYQYYLLKVRQNGCEMVDEDKQSMRECNDKELPNVSLLKARLLYDAGQYQRALSELETIDLVSLHSSKTKLEYTYRKGRIHQKQHNLMSAIKCYLQTIDNGKEEAFYFAANSALQLGLIYEELKSYEKARYYFNLCQNMKNKEYQTSIGQKAKAGLNRLTNQ